MWTSKISLLIIWTVVYIFFVNDKFGNCAAASANATGELKRPRNQDENLTEDEDIIATSYVLPNHIFNDGKPYYAGKDPISGLLDFSAKKTGNIEASNNEILDKREKISISGSSPNIHDFLNLPVKYSSSKFVYPLVSSSYANLKYQGNNKNIVTNKKYSTAEVTTTPEPNKHNNYQISTTTTKLMAVPTVSFAENDSKTTIATNPTFKGPSTTATTTTTTTTATTTTTTAIPHSTGLAPTVGNYPNKPFRRPSFPVRQSTTTRKPIPLTNPSTSVAHPTETTTRKKIVPTKKYAPTTVTASTTTTQSTSSSTTEATSTKLPNSDGITSYVLTNNQESSKKPEQNTVKLPERIHKDDKTTKPTLDIANISNFEAADIYQTLGQRNNNTVQDQKKLNQTSSTMTLADIFNSFAEEEFAETINTHGFHHGIDEDGNLMQPIVPSQPSPFAVHNTQQTISSNRPYTRQPGIREKVKTSTTASRIQQQHLHESDFHTTDIKNGQENEYVSYQVQQPNVMQYPPVPGKINNVVISHGQQSASFVLGSQQQVGTSDNDIFFGSKPLVQYGTVINENITDLKRPNFLPTTDNSDIKITPTVSTANGHQNGFSPNGKDVAPPPAPSPYQQLPLIGSSPRPKIPAHSQNPNIPELIAPTALPLHHRTQAPQTPESNPLQKPTFANDQQSLTTGFKFPTNNQLPEEIPSGLVSARPPTSPQVNGHAQPLSLQQIQHSSPVVFPKSSVNDHGNNDTYQNNVQIQQHPVILMKPHGQKLSFPQPDRNNAASLTHINPSSQSQPEFSLPGTPMTALPSVNNHSRYNPLHIQNAPIHNLSKEPTRKFGVNELNRDNQDHGLPNILPQFRPNAKISSGRPPIMYNNDRGNIHFPSSPVQTLQRPNIPSPQFAHRRQPMPGLKPLPMPPYHLSIGQNSPQINAEGANNRRIYHTQPYLRQMQKYDRLDFRRNQMAGIINRAPDVFLTERHVAHKDRSPAALLPDRLAVIEEEDLVINEPPHAMAPKKDDKNLGELKLEPVVTLQMLQSQKKNQLTTNNNIDTDETQVPSIDNHFDEKNNFADKENTVTTSQNGLYVVYPIHGNENSDDISPPKIVQIESTPSSSEYQNTPFSVIRDRSQEPILMAKSKKKQGLQQKEPNRTISKDKFPYPIEKPTPEYRHAHQKESDQVIIAPRIINGAFDSETETIGPIAIAYTPTEPTASNYQLMSKYSSQQASDKHDTAGNDFDIRGQRYEKDFMAPFFPSVNLDNTPKPHSNGWNILSSAQNVEFGQSDDNIMNNYRKNQIDRADVTSNYGEQNEAITDSPVPTKGFEVDKFQPQLQGGFKPIYPPGYTIETDIASTDKDGPEINANANLQTSLSLANVKEETNDKLYATTISTIDAESIENNSYIVSDESTRATKLGLASPTPQASTIKVSPTTEVIPRTNNSATEQNYEEVRRPQELKSASTAEPLPTAAALHGNNVAAVSPPDIKLIPRMGPRNLRVR